MTQIVLTNFQHLTHHHLTAMITIIHAATQNALMALLVKIKNAFQLIHAPTSAAHQTTNVVQKEIVFKWIHAQT
jgi:hypothetical protein